MNRKEKDWINNEMKGWNPEYVNDDVNGSSVESLDHQEWSRKKKKTGGKMTTVEWKQTELMNDGVRKERQSIK